MEQIKRINGNGQEYITGLPKIVMLSEGINDVAMAHIFENTGLVFKPTMGGYEAQPETSNQIVSLLLTYNYKSRYYNNGSYKNTLFLKSDHHVGFDVGEICFNCCKKNHIHIGGLKPGDYLAC